MKFGMKVLFDTQAVIVLPDAELKDIKHALTQQDGVLNVFQSGRNVIVEVMAGEYTFTYEPSVPYRKIYSVDSPMEELMENERTRKILEENYLAYRKKLPFQKELYTLDELLNGPFTSMPYEKQREIDKKLRETV